MKKSSFARSACVLFFLQAIAATAVVGFTGTAAAQAVPTAGVPCTPWPAVDALGRALPTPEEAGPPRPDRFVGIFYFLWHNQAKDPPHPKFGGPNDVAKILKADPNAGRKPKSPLWGPAGSWHYWGEPLYGYYLSTDPWVVRRHAHLLADAGVDTLIFDTTNAVTYPEVYLKLCETFRQVRAEGEPTPQIAFMVNTAAGATAQKIYDEFYRRGLYRELWFHWQGKPLLICDPAQASPELRKFFTLRRAHWPFTMVNTADAWHWEATYPQPYGYTTDPKRAEQVNVSVAQNLRVGDGAVTFMSNGNARGRSFHKGVVDASPDAIRYGRNFQEQWQRAFALQPPFVMVTGWNEWIATRLNATDSPVPFCDQYSQEYSRDIEPMKGGHGDDYYWQLIANVRRYKGVAAPDKASPPVAIDVAGGFEPWKAVGPEFRDHAGETHPRDFAGTSGLHYAEKSGRNDLLACKVARDDRNVYFHVRTREPISPHTDPQWMTLRIDADRNPATGREGFEFIINRKVDGPDATWLEKYENGRWTPVARLTYRVDGRQFHTAVPRAALDLPPGTKVAIDFQWADNLPDTCSSLDGYTAGDVAPEGRARYRYTAD